MTLKNILNLLFFSQIILFLNISFIIKKFLKSKKKKKVWICVTKVVSKSILAAAKNVRTSSNGIIHFLVIATMLKIDPRHYLHGSWKLEHPPSTPTKKKKKKKRHPHRMAIGRGWYGAMEWRTGKLLLLLLGKYMFRI